MNKEILFGTLAALLLFTNCSTDRETDEPIIEKTLLTKMTATYYDNPDNPETSVTTFNYNSKGELIDTNNSGQSSVFEYDNSGKPTKTIYYNSDKTYAYTNNYMYDGDRLTKINSVYDNPDHNRTVTYTYNTVGQVAESKLCQGQNCTSPITNTYTYSNGNILSEITQWSSVMSINTKREYTYDDNRNVYSTLNPHIRTMMGGALALSANNYKTEKISYKDASGNWNESQQINYTIEYGYAIENLPTLVTGKDQNDQLYVEYKYEYRML